MKLVIMKNLIILIFSFSVFNVFSGEIPLDILKLSCNDNSTEVGSTVKFKLVIGQEGSPSDPLEVINYVMEKGKLVIDQRFEVTQLKQKVDSTRTDFKFSAENFELKTKIYIYPLGYVIASLSGSDSRGMPLPTELRCTSYLYE